MGRVWEGWRLGSFWACWDRWYRDGCSVGVLGLAERAAIVVELRGWWGSRFGLGALGPVSSTGHRTGGGDGTPLDFGSSPSEGEQGRGGLLLALLWGYGTCLF